jgi:hypothetical protein
MRSGPKGEFSSRIKSDRMREMEPPMKFSVPPGATLREPVEKEPSIVREPPDWIVVS